ncbi:MAG: hypothetical protein IPN03_00885 [Holophagales bacterium]|nr:hypothetical protein [Holophagales bacterium]
MATSKASHERLLSSIETTYRLAERNFDRLFAAAATPQAREQVRDLYGAARDAYWKAVVASLEDHSSVVSSIHDDLKRTNRELKKSLESLEDVARTLAVLTEAVKLAASLVTLGAV